MACLGKLQSLNDLTLSVPKVTDAGLHHLANLKSLREVEIKLIDPSRIQGPGLAVLAEIPSLQRLWLHTFSKALLDGHLKYIKNLSSLKKLDIRRATISGIGFRHLSSLSKLEEIDLFNTPVTDDGLAHLAALPSVKRLRLDTGLAVQSGISDRGMVHLGKMRSLEHLRLPSTITDNGLVHLGQSKSLKSLNLKDNDISDKGLAGLGKIKSLESLIIWRPRARDGVITDKGLAYLSKLPNLKSLEFGWRGKPNFTEEGLKHLSRIKSLEELHLGAAVITNSELAHLAKLTNLRSLQFCSSAEDPVTDEGLAKLTYLRSLQALHVSGGGKMTVSALSCLNQIPTLTKLKALDIVQDDSGLNIGELTRLDYLRLKFAGDSGLRDEDMACLAKLTHLKDFQITPWAPEKNTFTDAGMAHLAALTSLRLLWVGSPRLTDKSLSYIANMKQMWNLRVSGRFTDKGLRHLEGLKYLERLRITPEQAFSETAAQRLQSSLPSVKVFQVMP
jgi:hypothetical protein